MVSSAPNSRRYAIIGAAVAAVLALIVGATVVFSDDSSPTSATGSDESAITVTCIGGSEKKGLMGDEEVQTILRDRYGITIDFVSMGSYEQVSLTNDELASREADCLWPSSLSAQSVFEDQHDKSSFESYRAATVLQSPEVIYAGPDGTEALIAAGIVEQRGDNYFVVDMKKLLVEYVQTGATWRDLDPSVPLSGPIAVSSTDPATSNSGFTLYQLMLTMLATDDVYTAPNVSEARTALPLIQELYQKQGLQASSSSSGFDQWLLQGGESHSPLYAGYESQIIEQVVKYADNEGVLTQLQSSVRILYPEPTIYADHPILALNNDARRFIEAMQDRKIQTIAWQRYGFRSGTEIGLNDVADFPSLQLAQQIRTTSPPKADVTLLLRECLTGTSPCR